MNEPDYLRILENLNAASRVLLAHRGELSSGDIRLRQMITTAEAEARRVCTQQRAVEGMQGAAAEREHV